MISYEELKKQFGVFKEKNEPVGNTAFLESSKSLEENILKNVKRVEPTFEQIKFGFESLLWTQCSSKSGLRKKSFMEFFDAACRIGSNYKFTLNDILSFFEVYQNMYSNGGKS